MLHFNKTKAMYVCCPSVVYTANQLSLSSSSSSVSPANFMFSFTTSIHLLFVLPLGLLPAGPSSIFTVPPKNKSKPSQSDHTTFLVSAPSQLSFHLSHTSPLTLLHLFARACRHFFHTLHSSRPSVPVPLGSVSFTHVFCVA